MTVPPPRANIHGSMIGTGDHNQLVRVCDARWWQLWRWFDLVRWCVRARRWPMTLEVPFVENGEMVVMYVVEAGTHPGVPSANAYREY